MKPKFYTCRRPKTSFGKFEQNNTLKYDVVIWRTNLTRQNCNSKISESELKTQLCSKTCKNNLTQLYLTFQSFELYSYVMFQMTNSLKKDFCARFALLISHFMHICHMSSSAWGHDFGKKKVKVDLRSKAPFSCAPLVEKALWRYEPHEHKKRISPVCCSFCTFWVGRGRRSEPRRLLSPFTSMVISILL